MCSAQDSLTHHRCQPRSPDIASRRWVFQPGERPRGPGDYPIGDPSERDICLLGGNKVAHVARVGHRGFVDFLIDDAAVVSRPGPRQRTGRRRVARLALSSCSRHGNSSVPGARHVSRLRASTRKRRVAPPARKRGSAERPAAPPRSSRACRSLSSFPERFVDGGPIVVGGGLGCVVKNMWEPLHRFRSAHTSMSRLRPPRP
jgi:hypothetical protein